MDQAVIKIIQALETIKPYFEVDKYEDLKKEVVGNYIKEECKTKEWEILFAVSNYEEEVRSL